MTRSFKLYMPSTFMSSKTETSHVSNDPDDLRKINKTRGLVLDTRVHTEEIFCLFIFTFPIAILRQVCCTRFLQEFRRPPPRYYISFLVLQSFLSQSKECCVYTSTKGAAAVVWPMITILSLTAVDYGIVVEFYLLVQSPRRIYVSQSSLVLRRANL